MQTKIPVPLSFPQKLSSQIQKKIVCIHLLQDQRQPDATIFGLFPHWETQEALVSLDYLSQSVQAGWEDVEKI